MKLDPHKPTSVDPPDAENRAVFDEHNCFFGHEPRECGEHRAVGEHRAWCFDCSEWCYPRVPCIRCEIIPLRAFAEAHGYDGGRDA